MLDAIASFRTAASVRGLILDGEVLSDGSIHRCRVDGGKSGRKDGSYLLHLDGLVAGGFQNFRDGLGWQDWSAEPARELNAAERAELRRWSESRQQARAAEQQTRQDEAARRAARLWKSAKPATNTHPYLERKGVHAYGIRALRDQLMIPARDADGTLWSLQFIGPDGSKRFLTGGRKRGCSSRLVG